MVLSPIFVVGLALSPDRVIGRHDAAAVGADELALGDDVREAKPMSFAFGDRQGALDLGLGAGHGQVGAELGAEALRLCVVDSRVQLGQTAAGTAVEAGRTAARIELCAWKNTTEKLTTLFCPAASEGAHFYFWTSNCVPTAQFFYSGKRRCAHTWKIVSGKLFAILGTPGQVTSCICLANPQ